MKEKMNIDFDIKKNRDKRVELKNGKFHTNHHTYSL
jgi:hypothetical protein